VSRYTTWLREVLDPSPEPAIVKQTANAMASFVDFATGCGTFSQKQLMRRLGMKDPAAVRKRIRAVIESGLIVIIEKGRRFLGATRYGLAVPGGRTDTRGELADFESGTGPDPLLTEESPGLDLFDEQDQEVVSGGSGPAPLSTADPTELKTTTPLSPLIADQGGGGGEDPHLGETTPRPAAPSAPVNAPDAEAIALLAAVAKAWRRPVPATRHLAAALAATRAERVVWPAAALVRHLADDPPPDLRRPSGLLAYRLGELPAGPGACELPCCERWRRDADAAAAREQRHPGRIDDHGPSACPEHDGRTRYLPTGRCEQCLLTEHPELAEPAPEVTGLPVRAETTVMIEQIRRGLSRRLSPTGGRR
jgi:hypothetical protein